MVSVLVVNDQPLQRVALLTLLASEPDLTIAGEAASEAQAIRMTAALHPDIVLMNSRLCTKDGIEAIRRIAPPAQFPQSLEAAERAATAPRVLVLTSSGHEGDSYAALRAGAGGSLLEDAAPDGLAAAIRVVAAGDAVVTPGLTRALIEAVRRQHGSKPPLGHPRLRALTERECDVLVAVASGWTNAEIAERLSISPTTVKTHVSHILTKIGARGRVQAVTFAYETGLVRPAA
ncbi:LuxR C-terminal-related transcriptional regulator [Streptomyces justiciae]|uniref:LuxR C-terminal-related transcriptional regulator n=1 Tax=Streptomyces justiciae TaxID=2780140 RepID=UPI002117B53D|nr:response regulator transcription factor [Streptomyces justiciae]MCW8378679.1 response regulator transcription factor [Streptomyces justiciae]